MDLGSLIPTGGGDGVSGDSGMSKSSSAATLGNYSAAIGGTDSKTLLWIGLGIAGAILLGFVLLVAVKD